MFYLSNNYAKFHVFIKTCTVPDVGLSGANRLDWEGR